MAPLNEISVDVNSIIEFINQNDYVIFSKTTCPFCTKAIQFFNEKSINPTVIQVDQHSRSSELASVLFRLTGQRTFPNIFMFSNQVGGFDDVKSLRDFETCRMTYQSRRNLNLQESQFDFDAVVIGGGSGGISFAKTFSNFNMRVALFDFVVPSPLGTKWGLGGTCVNVGCIPKKLMHQSSILRDNIIESKDFGFSDSPDVTHDWSKMMGNINNYIRSLNFGYRTDLRKSNVTYINALAKISSQHEVSYEMSGTLNKISAKYIVIATGERPDYPNIPGKQFGISSDDLFWLKYPPGKTLLVGASYVALECAGALKGMGFDVTVMVRSILLRGYDQEMAEKIGDFMQLKGIRFIRPAVPLEIEQLQPVDQNNNKPGILRVKYKITDNNQALLTEEFNTVIFAIGRAPCTSGIGLENVNMLFDDKRRIVSIDGREQTNVGNIFAIGDILSGKPQLTPVAIKAGQLLAKRLFNVSFENTNYNIVPTTVFTPLEYGAIGYSEEEALDKFGDDIDVYFNSFQPLEQALDHDFPPHTCYFAKLICRISQNNKVIGLHILAPNAGEITQGYAVALRMNATLTDFNSTFGIHPTVSEVFTNMQISRRSGREIKAFGC